MSDNKYERLSDDKVKLVVKVGPKEMNDFREKALRMLGEDLELGGFRRGRAPVSVLENSIDPVKLMMEMVDIAVKESYYDKVVELKDEFITIDSPKIEFKSKIEEKELLENGLEYSAEVFTYPEFSLPDFKTIKVDRMKTVVTTDEVNKALNSFLEKRSNLGPVKDNHKIKTGDWVDISFEVSVGENKLGDIGSKNFPLIVGNNSLIPGFEEQLIGLAKGEKKEFTVDVSADYREKRMAGKKVTFIIEVNEIKAVIVPEMNDEFVKGLNIKDVETKDKFTQFLQDNLTREKELANNEKLRNDLLVKLDEKIEFNVPDPLVDRELHLMWHEFEDNMISKGIDPKDYMEREKLDEKKIKSGWREQAEKRVKYGLIINQVIRDEKLDIEEKAVDQQIENELENIKKQLATSGQPDWQVTWKNYQEHYKRDDVKQQVKQRMLMDKMFDHLLSIVAK